MIFRSIPQWYRMGNRTWKGVRVQSESGGGYLHNPLSRQTSLCSPPLFFLLYTRCKPSSHGWWLRKTKGATVNLKRLSDTLSARESEQHSTFLEGLTANRNLQRAIHADFLSIIEVIDNSAWVFIARSGATPDLQLQHLLHKRLQIIRASHDVRVYSVWLKRWHTCISFFY